MYCTNFSYEPMEVTSTKPQKFSRPTARNDSWPTFLTFYEVHEPVALAKKFKKLVAKWKEETAFLSSPFQIFSNEAYLQIVGMGKDAIPLILQEMENEPSDLFSALHAITGEVVVDDDSVEFDAMTNAWLAWGRENGYR